MVSMRQNKGKFKVRYGKIEKVRSGNIRVRRDREKLGNIRKS